LASAFCSGLIEIRADEPAFLRVFYQGIPRLDEGESQNKLLGNLRLSPPEISDFFLASLPGPAHDATREKQIPRR
jgi:hypothetical protein